MTWRDERLVPVRAPRRRKLVVGKPANDNGDQIAADYPTKQSTRLLKAVCQANQDGQQCGYTVRVTRKWVDQLGAPPCPVHGPMHLDEHSRARAVSRRGAAVAEAAARREAAAANRAAAARDMRQVLGVEDALAEIPHLTEPMLVALGMADIKTLDDLADLATDELIAKIPTGRRRSQQSEDQAGILAEYGLSEEQGNEIIMSARARWFEGMEA